MAPMTAYEIISIFIRILALLMSFGGLIVALHSLINSSIMGKQKAGSCVKLEKLDNYGVALTEISGLFALI